MKKAIVITLGLSAAVMMLLTGCGERVNTETEVQTEEVIVVDTEAEAVTEVQIETQPATQPPTEPPTEAPTEPPTQPPTEDPGDLPEDQELAQESALAASVTYYANADLNVRNTPSTESADSIISSYDQGQEVTVIAKTPHWYKVQKEDYTGYVHRDGLSETLEGAMAGEGISSGAASEQTAPAETAAPAAQEAAPAAQEAAPVSAAPVSDYADSFPIVMTGNANVRVDASEKADVIGVVNVGDQLTAIGESGDWYQVDYNGSTGYVNKNLVG